MGAVVCKEKDTQVGKECAEVHQAPELNEDLLVTTAADMWSIGVMMVVLSIYQNRSGPFTFDNFGANVDDIQELLLSPDKWKDHPILNSITKLPDQAQELIKQLIRKEPIAGKPNARIQ